MADHIHHCAECQAKWDEDAEVNLSDAEVRALMVRVAELPVKVLLDTLEHLSEYGNESWKTPGHPMNEWVSKDHVQSQAKRALDRYRTQTGG